MTDIEETFAAIRDNPGLLTSALVTKLGLSRVRVEDAIWELWSAGRIQMDPGSTLRLPRPGEKIFRHMAP